MEEIRVAICEDEEQVMDLLVQSLKRSFAAEGTKAHFERFLSGSPLLARLEKDPNRYDAYFLDIEMPGLNGIELCREIRRLAPSSLVVFISNKEELVFQSLEVQPFRFIRKSHFVDEEERAVHDIVRELSRHRERFACIDDARTGRSVRIDLNALRVVEARRRECHLSVADETIVVRCRFQDMEKLLAGHDFLKPHRSYLVNVNSIYSIEQGSLTLESGEKVPLSRGRAGEVRRQFMDYLREL